MGMAPDPLTLVLVRARPGRAALAVLAGAVEAHAATAGVRVRVAAPGAALDRAVAESSTTGPVVVAWSLSSADAPAASGDLERARGAGGTALHVAGGPHPTADPEGTLRLGFDLAAGGEGEETVVQLLARVGEGRDPRGPGLAWTEGGRAHLGPAPSPVDLDAVPPFAPGHRRFGPIEITRGCAHACRFCQTTRLHGGSVRHRSAATVARWVRAMAEEGLRDVRFLSPSALAYGADGGAPDLGAIEELLSRAREAAGAAGRIFLGSFPSEIRPEHATIEGIRLLRRHVANDHLAIGAQSGSDRVLAACHRGHGVEDVRRAVRLALEGGFRARVDLIFGLPGESADDAAATRRFMRELADLGAEIRGHAFLPLPGTPWERAPAGEIDPETSRELERLASAGRARGHWRRHQALERAMAGPAGTSTARSP